MPITMNKGIALFRFCIPIICAVLYTSFSFAQPHVTTQLQGNLGGYITHVRYLDESPTDHVTAGWRSGNNYVGYMEFNPNTIPSNVYPYNTSLYLNTVDNHGSTDKLVGVAFLLQNKGPYNGVNHAAINEIYSNITRGLIINGTGMDSIE